MINLGVWKRELEFRKYQLKMMNNWSHTLREISYQTIMVEKIKNTLQRLEGLYLVIEKYEAEEIHPEYFQLVESRGDKLKIHLDMPPNTRISNTFLPGDIENRYNINLVRLDFHYEDDKNNKKFYVSAENYTDVKEELENRILEFMEV